MTTTEINQPAEGINSETIEQDAPDEGQKKSKSGIKKVLADRNEAREKAQKLEEQISQLQELLGVDDLSSLEAGEDDPAAKIEALVEKKMKAEKVQGTIKHYTDQLPEDDVEKFNELFNDFAEGKSLNEKNVNKIIRAAANELYADSGNQAAIDIAKQMAAGFGGGGGASQKTAAEKRVEKDVKWSRNFLEESGILPKRKD